MTVAEAIRAAAEQLAAISDTARLDAEVLMAHALGASRSDMLLRQMRDPASQHFERLIELRMRHMPVAYIVGTQEFWGIEFAVSPDVLIPRADSETTLGAAIEAKPDATRVLDMGTGSGALLLACLTECDGATGIGIDASPAALRVATLNAERLNLADRARFLQGDWTLPGWADSLGMFDLIICNPPYVEDDAALAPQVRDWEPAVALFSGPEGLDDYRAIVPQLGKILSPGGVAVLEIGANQAMQVARLAEDAGFQVAIRNDLAGRDRALILR